MTPVEPGRAGTLPTGTVTFLFTDMEGSTRLLQALGDAYAEVLSQHNRLLAEAAQAHDGRLIGSEGDAVFMAFSSAKAAVATAAAAQRALAEHAWPEDHPVRVRMGIHSGEVQLRGDAYVGLALHRVARISAAANGGQVLLSEATAGLVGGSLEGGLTLHDLGRHRLKDLAQAEHLFELTVPGLERTYPPIRTLEARPNNLPVQVTTFVGRRELEAARTMLATSRLVTLTGPGGTGKTRLALQLAGDAADEYPDGVFFVALDAVTDPELVASAIAEALGVEVATEPPIDRVVRSVRDRHLLIVLDNFEQVIDAAPAVARLLREAPAVGIVVTSRVVLRISGEQEFRVPPLGLPEPGASLSLEDAARSEAVTLFVERAMAIDPRFSLTAQNAPAIGDIVVRLDGLPLAIELAAARVRVLPVESIRTRLVDRLTLLTGGARDLPARQQTLRGAIEWSHDLLDEADRRLFRRFAMFSGGAGLAEAEAVCGPASDLGRDVLDGLASLSEKSLVRLVESRTDPASGTAQADEARFAMLATIREYALERLAESDEAETIQRRHAEACLALAELAAPELTGRQSGLWLDRLALDHDNLRAANDWAIRGDEAAIALRMVIALWRFWQIRGHLPEAQTRTAAALGLPGSAKQPAALRARALMAAGSIEYWRGDFVPMSALYVEALAEARRSGDRATLAEALYNHAFSAEPDTPDSKDAVTIRRAGLEESLAVYRELDDARGIANATWAIGAAALFSRELTVAREYLGASLDTYRGLGETFGLGWTLRLLGMTELLDSEIDLAEARLRESLAVFEQGEDLSAIVSLLGDLAEVARRRGQVERRWVLAGAAQTLRLRTGADLMASTSAMYDMEIPEAPTDDPLVRASWDRGAAMSSVEMVAYAQEDAR